MTTYICKCGRRVQKSSNADNTGNRLKGYGPGHECYGCPYVLSWGTYEWNEEAKNLEQKTKGYECRMSKTLSYASQFIGSTKDKCTCSVVSLDFDFLEQISAWVKETFTLGELTGHFSRDEIRATDYSHDGRYNYGLYCAGNKKGIAAKAALFAQFFNQDGSRKDMTPQQEMEKVLTDIRKAKEVTECATVPNADAAATTAEIAVPNATEETLTTSASVADASASADGSSAPMPSAPTFDFGADNQTNALLLQDAQTFIVGTTARIMAAKHAHDLCANNKNGTWGKWCAAVGISRDTGDRFVNIAAQCGNIQIEGKSILDVQPLKLLYAATKPSTPEEVKQAVFTGDITTYKEYQELLAQIKAKEHELEETRARLKNSCLQEEQAHDALQAANAQLEATQADVTNLQQQYAQMSQKANDAEEARIAAEAREEEAWQMQSKAEARAKDAEDALKKQPITAVVDKDEVQRQADALAAKAKAQASKQIEDAQRRAREAEEKFEKLQQAADGFLAPEQACAQQAKIIADSMRSMYLGWFGLANGTGTPLARMAAPIYQVCDEIRESLEDDTTIKPTAAGSEEDAEREALFE